VRYIETNSPPVDILINNAGSLVKRARLAEYTEDLFDRVMDLNVKTVYFVTQAVAPGMIGRGRGVVVNVSSIAARNGGGSGATIYSAAKAAVSTMTKGLAKELAPKGIRVNAVSPGTVDNYFHEQFSKELTKKGKESAVIGAQQKVGVPDVNRPGGGVPRVINPDKTVQPPGKGWSIFVE
jgi:NAD(P)-dependent dehydrogenase (short-subunit alcohol dehydrogenase family)